MIILKEDSPLKLSGLTSIFVSTDLVDNINFIKKTMTLLDVYYYHNKLKTWEFQCSELSKVFNSLIKIDNIKLVTKENEGTKNTSIQRVVEYKTQPFSYQLEGIEYGLAHDKWLLLDAPGLGKTLQLIYLAEELKAQRNIEHCFIICGLNILKSNWKREILKHSSYSCTILGEKLNKKGKTVFGGISERVAHIKRPIEEFFIITNIETLRDDKFIDAYKNSVNKIDMIVVDEIHKCKSKKSIQGSNLLKLTAKYMIGATGTLLLNTPFDAYVPLAWIKADHSTLTTFKKQYSFFDVRNYQIFKNLDTLKEELEHFSLRRTKEILTLPQKYIYDELIDMDAAHKKFYDEIKEGIKNQVDKVSLNSKDFRALLTRLRQASVLPSILSSNNISSSKLDRCVDLANQILSDKNEKLLIFSTFKDPCYVLQQRLAEYNPIIVTGDTKENIDELTEKIQNDDNCRLIIATWQKLGTGCTFTRIHYMIFLDTPWTKSSYDQACDRIHRVGTTSSVFIFNLICIGTVDEMVMNILKRKQAISDYISDDILDDTTLRELKNYILE